MKNPFTPTTHEKSPGIVTGKWLSHCTDIDSDTIESEQEYETTLTGWGVSNVESGVYGIDIDRGIVQGYTNTRRPLFKVLIGSDWVSVAPKDFNKYYAQADSL